MNWLIFTVLTSLFSQSITWTTKTSLPQSLAGSGCAVINDTVYVIGGRDSGGNRYKTNYVYDPVGDSWSTKTSMITARAHLGAAVVSGNIYAIGGWVGGSPGATGAVEEYDPVTGTWTSKAPMPTPRYAFTIAVVGNLIYVIGGMDNTGQIFSTIEEYDPANDSWSTKTSMPTARMGPGCAVIRDTIYVFGGSTVIGAGVTTVNQCYDPTTDNWASKAPMSVARYALGGFSYNNMGYAVGGYNYSSYFTTVEVYDPVSNNWSSETPMQYARQSVAVGLVGNKVYVIGGWNNGALSYNEEGTLAPTAVDMISFSALPQSCSIEVRWTSPCSDETFQYVIERSADGNNAYSKIARIPGTGFSPLPKSYSYEDKDVKLGIRYFYKLGVMKMDGNTQWYGPVSAVITATKPFLSISPNPFTKKTVIRYSSIVNSKDSHLKRYSLRIYETCGRLVKRFTIHDLRFTDVTWDGKDDYGKLLPSGIYYIRLTQGSLTETKKLLFVK